MGFRVGNRTAALVLAFLPSISCAQQLAQPARVQSQKTARDRARAAMQTGLVEYTQTRNEKALQQALASAIDIDPTYPDPYFNMAMLAQGHENWPYAIALLSVAVQSSPADSAIHKRAQQQLASVQAVQKTDATTEGRKHRLYAAAIARATTFLNNGLLQPAVSEAAVAAKIDPNGWEAYAVTADALSHGNRPEEAKKFVDMALARAPADIQNQIRERAVATGGRPVPPMSQSNLAPEVSSGNALSSAKGRIVAILKTGSRFSLDAGSAQPMTVWLDDRTECASIGSALGRQNMSSSSLQLGDEIAVVGEISADHQRMLARTINVQKHSQ